MLLFFTLWACSESDVLENNNSNHGNEVSQNIQNANDAGAKTKAPLQKEAKAGRNLNSGRVPTQQELVYGECPPTKGSKGEKDLGFRVPALGFKVCGW